MIAVFSVDSSPNIGAGHVMRCLTLARQLKAQGIDIHFFSRSTLPHVVDQIQELGQLHRLPVMSEGEIKWDPVDHTTWLGCDWLIDAKQAVSTLVKLDNSVKYLIVDHYGIDANWEEVLRPHVQTLLVIDDLADRAHQCDFLLDQTFGRLSQDYQKLVNVDAKLLVGSEYAMLRSEFNRFREDKSEDTGSGAGIAVLLALGGGRGSVTTLKIIEQLEMLKLERISTIDVIVDNCDSTFDKIASISNESFYEIRLHHFVREVASLMASSSIAIGAPATSLWERCCMGLPSIIIPIASNQKAIASSIESVNAAVLLMPDSIDSQLKNKIEDLLSNIESYSTAGMTICDGLGVNRVVANLLPLKARDGGNVTLRYATEQDIQRVHRWQCRPETRRHARNQQMPSLEGHDKWMRNKLSDPYCYFYIIYHKDKPVGALRMDRIEKREYEISIFIMPEVYGVGISSAALDELKRIHQHVDFIAEILPSNKASIKLFLGCDYKMIKSNIYAYRQRS